MTLEKTWVIATDEFGKQWLGAVAAGKSEIPGALVLDPCYGYESGFVQTPQGPGFNRRAHPVDFCVDITRVELASPRSLVYLPDGEDLKERLREVEKLSANIRAERLGIVLSADARAQQRS
jgi:hypothetical protein